MTITAKSLMDDDNDLDHVVYGDEEVRGWSLLSGLVPRCCCGMCSHLRFMHTHMQAGALQAHKGITKADVTRNYAALYEQLSRRRDESEVLTTLGVIVPLAVPSDVFINVFGRWYRAMLQACICTAQQHCSGVTHSSRAHATTRGARVS